MIFGQAMLITRVSRISAEHALRWPSQISCRESVDVPAQIVREPLYYLEPGGGVSELNPAGGALAYMPAKPMAFYQQFDAVTEATIGLDRDPVDDAAREQTKAIAGIVRWQACKVVEREICRTHQKIL